MALEIKELHIKVSVNDVGKNKPNTREFSAHDQNAIIQICVDKILDILKRKQER